MTAREVMSERKFALLSCTAFLSVAVLQVLLGCPAVNTRSLGTEHRNATGSDQIAPEVRLENYGVRKTEYTGVREQREERHAANTKLYSIWQTLLKLKVRVFAFDGVFPWQQPKKETAEHSSRQSAESAAVSRSKRELEQNGSTSESKQAAAQPEPVPEWKAAIDEWGWAWYLHVYLFAVLYTYVAIFALVVTVLKLFSGVKKAKSGLRLSLHISLFLFSVTRALVLSIDPYGSQGIMGVIVTYVLWSVGFPIIITSYGLVLLVLFDTTKLSLAPPKYQNSFVALGIMGVNFMVVSVTDVIVLLYAGSTVLIIICQTYLSLAGLAFTAGFIWVAYKIWTRVAATIRKDNKLKRLLALIILAVVISISLVGVQIYAAVAVFGIDSEATLSNPWPWYAMQTCLRILELGMCVVIFRLFSSGTSRVNKFTWKYPPTAHFRVCPMLNESAGRNTAGGSWVPQGPLQLQIETAL